MFPPSSSEEEEEDPDTKLTLLGLGDMAAAEEAFLPLGVPRAPPPIFLPDAPPTPLANCAMSSSLCALSRWEAFIALSSLDQAGVKVLEEEVEPGRSPPPRNDAVEPMVGRGGGGGPLGKFTILASISRASLAFLSSLTPRAMVIRVGKAAAMALAALAAALREAR